MDHISAGFPLYDPEAKYSGGQYEGVPLIVFVVSLTFFAKESETPKSEIFTKPALSTRMLLGLRSR